MNPQKKVADFTIGHAENWANGQPFNRRPSPRIFKRRLLSWMESEGFAFRDGRDAEKVWLLFKTHVDLTRQKIIDKQRTEDMQLKYLFSKPRVPGRRSKKD
jgi:hypothetical protein